MDILAGDIDYQHESDKGDPQSEISEVLVKLNPPKYVKPLIRWWIIKW